MVGLVILKSQVGGYTRANGTVVNGYDNHRASHAPTVTDPHIKVFTRKQAGDRFGAAPEGATHVASWDFGKGPVHVWSKKSGGRTVPHDGKGWAHGRDELYVARARHMELS